MDTIPSVEKMIIILDSHRYQERRVARNSFESKSISKKQDGGSGDRKREGRECKRDVIKR